MPKEKILIADDEPHVLALCKRVIEKEGYQVVSVSSGYEAIEAAKQQSFDLLLTDIMMPGMSGLDAAQIIRQHLPDIIAVVMTGFGTMETAIQSIRLGFTEFVEKPFKPSALVQAVNRAMEKERLRRENTRLKALIPLFELNKTLMTNIDPDRLAFQALQTACTELRADKGILVLKDKNQHSYISAMVGLETPPISVAIWQSTLDERQQILISSDQTVDGPVGDLAKAWGVHQLLFNPLQAMDVIVGAMVLVKSEETSFFATGDSELMSVLCGQAAVALQNALLFAELQRAYEQLQQVDHIKSEFINIAAHELRTPLAILLGHADLLESEIQDPGIKERLKIIVRNALRLRELITALFDMRLLQTGEYDINLSDVDLAELIEDVLQDLRPMAERKSLQVQVITPPELSWARTDRQKAHILLSNLVSNAIKFTPDHGQIVIQAQDHGKEIWLSVSDTGIGIPETELENIFRPFYQVEESLTREHEGIGLGLSIAKGMAELCGGRIWVESILKQGSCFTFSLPK